MKHDRMRLTKSEKLCFPELREAMRRHQLIEKHLPNRDYYSRAELAVKLDRLFGRKMEER